jgi:hypothetical protein
VNHFSLLIWSLVAGIASCTAVVTSLGQAAPSVRPQAEAVLTQFAEPIFPRLAQIAHVSGTVEVKIDVGRDGAVESALVVSGHPLLIKAALESARRLRFDCRECTEAGSVYLLRYDFRFLSYDHATDCSTWTDEAVLAELDLLHHQVTVFAKEICEWVENTCDSPQAMDKSTKQDDLYSMALFASIAQFEKSYGQFDDGNHGSRIRTDYRRMPVRKDSELADHLPSQVGDYRVEYLDDQALSDRYKSQRKDFSILEIHPIHSEGPRLKVQVSLSWATYRNGRLVIEISDWSDVSFDYDCEGKAYVISAVKLGGI